MQLRKLLVGLDFNEPSWAAARWLAHYLGPEVELVLVHVVPVPERPTFLADVLPPADEVLEESTLAAEARIGELERSLGHSRASTMVRVGRPADEMARLAEDIGADAMAVAEHARRGAVAASPGSTAEGLLRSAHVPVFLARHLRGSPPRRILVPLDESELTGPVLGWASLLADRFGASVTAFHALSPGLFGRARTTGPDTSVEALERELRSRTEAWLRKSIESAGLTGARPDVQVGFGDPAYEIVAAASDVDAELVVMGSRGAGSISPALLGGKASAVIRSADVPIFVVTDDGRA